MAGDRNIAVVFLFFYLKFRNHSSMANITIEAMNRDSEIYSYCLISSILNFDSISPLRLVCFAIVNFYPEFITRRV